ncbi:MAG: ribonuclease P protein subunit [Candidatus Woesearchaeota archaeon]|jgi:RNase P/RNase MRP subunit p29|nr:ribonuclease P protein subunit [Candidatus Woesearchaeota archaeon]
MDVKKIMTGELIGLQINMGQEKVKIIDETKNMIVVETKNGDKKKLMKKNNQFEVIVDDQTVKIEGNKLLLRPEERVKIR